MQRITCALVLAAAAAGFACDNYESQAAPPTYPSTNPPAVTPDRTPVNPEPPPLEPPAIPPVEQPIAPPPVEPPPAEEPPVTPPPADQAELDRQAEQKQQDSISSATSQFAALRVTLSEIENKLRSEGDAAPAAWTQLRDDLKTKLESAEAKVSELQTAARDQWQALTVELDQMMSDLAKGFDEARKTILG